jgi:uncharacterized protein YgiB involved in biofilm formation
MKAVAVIGTAAILTAGAVVSYVMLTGGECAGSVVYRDVAACVSRGRTMSGCEAYLAEANRRLTQRGPVFDMRQQCEDRYSSCQPADGASGFVPRATGFCVRTGPPDRVVPIFGPG